MYCVKRITDDLVWVGANDRRLAMFEGVYSVPRGVSYNAYLLIDQKTVLFDTVDKAVRERFLENVAGALGGRALDYLVVQHMEPDHSAAILEMMGMYPDMLLVCNKKTLEFIKQFYDFDADDRVLTVGENDTLDTGRHTLRFIMAPMVHWPEVMVTYDTADRILFSADAFGCFGALNGSLFADEVDFAGDYMDEARRYYANIVGKYGTQVQSLLEKVTGSDTSVEMICPLHGFVWRRGIDTIVSKYALWSGYKPEEEGVLIAYASVYGHTENVAEILACKLRDRGIKVVMFDVSVTPASEIVSGAFRWSHLVFASTTYNAGIFVTMEALISDLAAHNIKNRTVAIIENGSWAPTSGALIREKLKTCKDIRFIDETVSILSGFKEEKRSELDKMADAIAATFTDIVSINAAAAATSATPAATVTVSASASAQTHVSVPVPAQTAARAQAQSAVNPVAREAMFKLSYGLFILTANEDSKDNGCIINTVTQITESPTRISIAVNKANYTHDMILRTGIFNVSILTEGARFSAFERFGFHSGRDTDKFDGYNNRMRADNGILYATQDVNAVICAKVAQALDYGTHTVFIADVPEAFTLSGEPSVTYQYYFAHIKPKPQRPKETKKGFVCKICGYVHEGENLPEDFICPLCKHGSLDFEQL